MAATCPHDDDPLTCPPCQGRNPLVPAHNDRTASPTWGKPFTACYTTRCGCGDVIEPGDSARALTDKWGDTYTVHAECAGEVA